MANELGLFLEQEGLGSVVPNQCEVSYINHIEAAGWAQRGELHRVLSFWQRIGAMGLPDPEDATAALRFVMEEGGTKLGRLHVSLKSAARRSDSKPVLVLEFTARGMPLSGDLKGALQFMDRGRDWIHTAFQALTSGDARSVNSGGCVMSEGGTDAISMYRDSRNERLPGTAASVGLLEPFESEDWNVDWARPRSSDVSSLTVQTLIAQPSEAALSVWSEFSERIGAIGEARWEEFDALEVDRRSDTLLTGPVAGVLLAVETRPVGARLQWRSADAVVTLALDSPNPDVSNREAQTGLRQQAALSAPQPATD